MTVAYGVLLLEGVKTSEKKLSLGRLRTTVKS